MRRIFEDLLDNIESRETNSARAVVDDVDEWVYDAKFLDKPNYTTMLSFLISGYLEEEYWEMTQNILNNIRERVSSVLDTSKFVLDCSPFVKKRWSDDEQDYQIKVAFQVDNNISTFEALNLIVKLNRAWRSVGYNGSNVMKSKAFFSLHFDGTWWQPLKKGENGAMTCDMKIMRNIDSCIRDIFNERYPNQQKEQLQFIEICLSPFMSKKRSDGLTDNDVITACKKIKTVF